MRSCRFPHFIAAHVAARIHRGGLAVLAAKYAVPGVACNRDAIGRRSPRNDARGFTLIEIMVVIVILGVLAALVVPRVLERPDEARAIAAKSDIATLLQALKLYRLDNQRYPTAEQGLAALVMRPEMPPVPANWKPNGYLDKLRNDPWGRPYQYLNPGLKGEIDVWSFGADGQPGGAGHDGDIGSWDL